MILPAPALVLSTDLDQARGWFWVLGFRVGCHRCGPKRPTRQSGAANHRHPHRRGATGGHSDGGVWIWTRQQCPPVARAWCSSVRVRQGDEGVPTGPCKASTERHDDTVRLRKNACSGAPSRVQQGPTQHRRLSKSNRPAEPPRRMILPALALVPSTDLDQARGWSWVLGFGVGPSPMRAKETGPAIRSRQPPTPPPKCGDRGALRCSLTGDPGGEIKHIKGDQGRINATAQHQAARQRGTSRKAAHAAWQR